VTAGVLLWAFNFEYFTEMLEILKHKPH